MDVASSLIRSVVRSFYTTEQILIVDALIIHSTLRDDDLALVMGMQTKQLRKICGRLREDGLLSVHSRPELRDGAQRPFNRDYYFINFHRAIDVIKYRMKKVSVEIEKRYSQTVEEKKDYYCPRCKSQYTSLDALENVGLGGIFECKLCGTILKDIENNENPHNGHEVQNRLNTQVAAFEALLGQIDNTTIPENDFDMALQNARPVIRDATLNPAAKTEVVSSNSSRLAPATVRGLRTEPEKIMISLLDDSQAGKDQEAAAEAERKAKLAAQNALPSWHVVSTVTGENTGIGANEDAAQREREANGHGPKLEPRDEEEKKKIMEDSSTLNSYFAALKEEQEREARQDRQEQAEEDDEDGPGDEDEDDFEDVGIETEEQPTGKRVRIEEPEKPEEAGSTGANGPIQKKSEGGGDSDEDEFEDVV